ncbi:MAG TPA: hypothetical protein VMF09_01200 [Solirubrobacteraceae bacterium]|nr:hypothetical protein [Solirubrobacteraceae bacterium]
MSRVRIALAAGLALLAIALGLTLARSPAVVARKSDTPVTEDRLAVTATSARYCQSEEQLPAGASAIRLSLAADTGPRVDVSVSSGGRTLTSGTQGAGWTGRVVTVPVRPLARTVGAVTVCASVRPRFEQVLVFGVPAAPALAARDGRQTLPGRMTIEYLRRGSRSWASLAPSIARRLGLGRTAAGTWNALLAVELLVAIGVLASMLVLKELG